MRHAALILTAPLAVAALASPAAAQYREGLPPVMAPPPPRIDPSAFGEGQSVGDYRRAGSPRLVVFWNRELSDRTSAGMDTVITEHGESAEGAAAAVSRSGRYSEGARVAAYEKETRIGLREAPGDARSSLMSEEAEWRFMEAFQGRLMSAGIRLVDRPVAMRAIAASQDGPSDRQKAEMAGIARMADLMLAIVQAPAPDTPLGIRFKVAVTDLRDGTILATFVDDGNGPTRGPGRFVAGANGFERERAPSVEVESAGANLASALLARLAGRWR